MNIEEIKAELASLSKTADTRVKSVETENAKLLDRIELLESKGSYIGGHVSNGDLTKERAITAFGKYCKALAQDNASMKAEAEEEMQHKDFTGLSDGAGGATIPSIIGTEIIQRARQLSPVMQFVRNTPIITTPDRFSRPIANADNSTGWAAETGTRSATVAQTYNKFAPTGGMLYAYPAASEEAFYGSQFDVGDLVIEGSAQGFAAEIGNVILVGSGSDRPTGLLNATPVVTADFASPLRAWNVCQYLPTGAAGAFQNDYRDSPVGDPIAVFFDVLGAIRPQFSQRGRWYMSPTTLATISKLRDADGNSILTPSLSEGSTLSLLGYPVVLVDHLVAIAANSHSILFGDLNVAYELVHSFNTRVTLDEITTPGMVKFYVRQYIGGGVTSGEAYKVIKFAAS